MGPLDYVGHTTSSFLSFLLSSSCLYAFPFLHRTCIYDTSKNVPPGTFNLTSPSMCVEEEDVMEGDRIDLL